MTDLTSDLLSQACKEGIFTGGSDKNGNYAYVVIDSTDLIVVTLRPGGRATIVKGEESTDYTINENDGEDGAEDIIKFFSDIAQALIDENLDHKAQLLTDIIENNAPEDDGEDDSDSEDDSTDSEDDEEESDEEDDSEDEDSEETASIKAVNIDKHQYDALASQHKHAYDLFKQGPGGKDAKFANMQELTFYDKNGNHTHGITYATILSVTRTYSDEIYDIPTIEMHYDIVDDKYSYYKFTGYPTNRKEHAILEDDSMLSEEEVAIVKDHLPSLIVDMVEKASDVPEDNYFDAVTFRKMLGGYDVATIMGGMKLNIASMPNGSFQVELLYGCGIDSSRTLPGIIEPNGNSSGIRLLDTYINYLNGRSHTMLSGLSSLTNTVVDEIINVRSTLHDYNKEPSEATKAAVDKAVYDASHSIFTADTASNYSYYTRSTSGHFSFECLYGFVECTIVNEVAAGRIDIVYKYGLSKRTSLRPAIKADYFAAVGAAIAKYADSLSSGTDKYKVDGSLWHNKYKTVADLLMAIAIKCGYTKLTSVERAANDLEVASDYNIGKTILRQLGGDKFVSMTGAKNLVWLKTGLQFDIPVRHTKNKASRVSIVLEANDSYTMEFYRYNAKNLTLNPVGKPINDVHAENLAEIFEDYTGLATSLGGGNERANNYLEDDNTIDYSNVFIAHRLSIITNKLPEKFILGSDDYHEFIEVKNLLRKLGIVYDYVELNPKVVRNLKIKYSMKYHYAYFTLNK